MTMKMTRFAAILTVMLVLAGGTASWRANAYDVIPQQAAAPLVPVKVDIVLSRSQGDKKVSSLPYSLSVNANSMRWGGRVSQLRMGSQIPVPTVAQPKTADGKPVPVPVGAVPFTYKDIGTSIDCTAVSTDDGRYQVNLSIDESSVYSGDSVAGDTPRANDVPIFRSFRSTNELILKDGQSAQFTAATDRVSGEVVRIDVTLTVRK